MCVCVREREREMHVCVHVYMTYMYILIQTTFLNNGCSTMTLLSVSVHLRVCTRMTITADTGSHYTRYPWAAIAVIDRKLGAMIGIKSFISSFEQVESY